SSFQVLSWAPRSSGSPPPPTEPPPPPTPATMPPGVPVGGSAPGTPASGYSGSGPASPSTGSATPGARRTPHPAAAPTSTPSFLGSGPLSRAIVHAFKYARDVAIGLLVLLGLLLATASTNKTRLPKLLVPLPVRVKGDRTVVT
ncbi:MAG TPA: hypothetical protein VGU43_03870, partial [Thermoplasmata archaeon]|nr:hypothetical protein [Thermoplasmata archaeon]